MGSCRACGQKMTHEAFQAHRCPLKVEAEVFAQRFPDRPMAAKAAFFRTLERRRRAAIEDNKCRTFGHDFRAEGPCVRPGCGEPFPIKVEGGPKL